MHADAVWSNLFVMGAPRPENEKTVKRVLATIESGDPGGGAETHFDFSSLAVSAAPRSILIRRKEARKDRPVAWLRANGFFAGGEGREGGSGAASRSATFPGGFSLGDQPDGNDACLKSEVIGEDFRFLAVENAEDCAGVLAAVVARCGGGGGTGGVRGVADAVEAEREERRLGRSEGASGAAGTQGKL